MVAYGGPSLARVGAAGCRSLHRPPARRAPRTCGVFSVGNGIQSYGKTNRVGSFTTNAIGFCLNRPCSRRTRDAYHEATLFRSAVLAALHQGETQESEQWPRRHRVATSTGMSIGKTHPRFRLSGSHCGATANDAKEFFERRGQWAIESAHADTPFPVSAATAYFHGFWAAFPFSFVKETGPRECEEKFASRGKKTRPAASRDRRGRCAMKDWPRWQGLMLRAQ